MTSLFENELQFDPGGDFEVFLRSVPAKWAVYVLDDAEQRPVQLLCVKNLRYSLKHRLGGDQTLGLTKRVNYREIVRRVRWIRVDSAFEADWRYYEAAQALFPQTYRGMIGFRPAWFIHVNPETNFPRYLKTKELAKTGVLLGPLEDKHAAARLIELVEDLFDLCRYYHILIQAPHGSACAYKGMGKCPAPCDGSISMTQYRRLVAWGAQTLVDPTDLIREQTRRMQAAATELRFETAAKIKIFLAQLEQIGKGAYRHVRRLEDFRFISIQPGPRAGTAKAFLVTPGHIEELAGLMAEPVSTADLLRTALERSAAISGTRVDAIGAERVGIVSHHLFAARRQPGTLIPLNAIDEKSILKAWRDLRKAPPQEAVEEEGVVKELQSL